MLHAFSARRAPSTRRRLVISMVPVAVALGAILASAGPAAAAGSGKGTFTGDEHAPASTLIDPPLPNLCAKFDPLAPDSNPLYEDLNLVGTFTNSSGGGVFAGTATAKFTSTNASYYANPVGTYSDPGCSVPYAVPGTMTLNTGTGVGPAYNCSGSATYKREASSVITITFTATCNPPGTGFPTTVTFKGAEVPCGPVGCPDPDGSTFPVADALLSGTYQQS